MGLRLSGTKACAWRRYITVTGFISIFFSKLTLFYPVYYGPSLSDGTQQTKLSSLLVMNAMLANSATIRDCSLTIATFCYKRLAPSAVPMILPNLGIKDELHLQ